MAEEEPIFPINGTDFFCRFKLTGPSTEGVGAIEFTKSAIINFELEENFFEPFSSARVTVNNPLDFVENNVFTRGDGKDKFSIELYNTKDTRPKEEINTKLLNSSNRHLNRY